MTGDQLAKYRKGGKRTQVQTAEALGVSQTYLSLLEAGKRPLSERLQRKAARFFDLSPTHLPAHFESGHPSAVTDDELVSDLADLGYPGFAHLGRKRPRRKNPAEVLFNTLNADQRDARIMEALPWLALAYPDMDWPELIKAAKVNDLQNRLGFVVSLARELAENRRDKTRAAKLRRQEQTLEPSRLAREDTFCNQSMTNAERRWLATNRPETAKHWRLLTSLSAKLVRYANLSTNNI